MRNDQKKHHRDTENTEDMNFSPGRETAPRGNNPSRYAGQDYTKSDERYKSIHS
jgi:hypothetical protein